MVESLNHCFYFRRLGCKNCPKTKVDGISGLDYLKVSNQIPEVIESRFEITKGNALRYTKYWKTKLDEFLEQFR